MKYIEFLNLLLSYGPKVGPVLEELQAIVEEVMLRWDNIRTILGISRDVMRTVAPTAEEIKLEREVMQAVQEGRSAGPLQSIFDFIRANPEILQLLLLFLKR